MSIQKSPIGLRERIAVAETIEEVRRLLALGLQSYHLASFKTVRQWQVAATRRIKVLEAAAQRTKELEAAKPAPGVYVNMETGTEVRVSARAERRRARKAAK